MPIKHIRLMSGAGLIAFAIASFGCSSAPKNKEAKDLTSVNDPKDEEAEKRLERLEQLLAGLKKPAKGAEPKTEEEKVAVEARKQLDAAKAEVRDRRQKKIAKAVAKIPGQDKWLSPAIPKEQVTTCNRTTRARGHDTYLAMRGQVVNWPLAPQFIRGRKAPVNMLLISTANGGKKIKRAIVCAQEQQKAGDDDAKRSKLGYINDRPVYPRKLKVRQDGKIVELTRFPNKLGETEGKTIVLFLPDSLQKYTYHQRDSKTGKVEKDSLFTFWVEYEDGTAGGAYGRMKRAQDTANGSTAEWVDWSDQWVQLRPGWRSETKRYDQIAFYPADRTK